MRHQEHSHCSFCGTRFPAVAVKHALCAACGRETWLSPKPVSVMVLPVEHAGGIGVLLVRRDIEPCRGQLALPGGYVDFSESLEEAARRELREETGVDLPPDWPIRITHSRQSHDALTIAFCTARPVPDSLVPSPFVPNEETQAIMLVNQPIPLCFITHVEALKMHFDRQQGLLAKIM